LTGEGEDEVLQVNEILVPLPDGSMRGVLIRFGDRYRQYGKYTPQASLLLQSFLRGE
jgi:hypothetical protein